MPDWVVPAVAFSSAVVLAVVWYRRALSRRRLLDRIRAPVAPADAPVRRSASETPFVRRWYLLPWLFGLSLLLGVRFGLDWKAQYAVSIGLIVSLIANELDKMRVSATRAKMEAQLGAAIDLMVGSLQAGGSVVNALESARTEARAPLRPELDELIGRIRLGDDPQSVLKSFQRRIPLENVRLFASALSVHWEVGGSLAPTLGTVGRSIRDRIEISRRIRSLTAQARFSVAAVLLVSYFIAVIIWRNNPDRMEAFVKTQAGSWLIGGVMLLQGLGIAWSASMSRVKF